MSWVPTTDFEEEIVSLQPDHNFIFGALSEPEPEVFYPRPKTHLDFAAKQKKNRQKINEDKSTSQKLSIIAEVQRITGSKPLGELPTVDDWNGSDNVEEETIAMMRHFGLGPSIEQPLDEKLTLPTLPVNKGIYINQQGKRRMPIIFDDNFFKWDVPDYTIPPADASYDCNNTADGKPVNSLNDSSVYSTTSQSFSTADEEEPRQVNGKCSRYARTTLVDYEQLPDTACGSRMNLLNESKIGETEPESEDQHDPLKQVEEDAECSYKTPNSGDNIIFSQSWYRSEKKANNIHKTRTSIKRNTYADVCGSRTSSSSSSSYYPTYPQQQRFYTAKELYQLKRQNQN